MGVVPRLLFLLAAGALLGCGSAGATAGDAGSCGSGGRLSRLGHCVYETSQCPTGLRFGTGECVLPAGSPSDCGCAIDSNDCIDSLCADGECVHPPVPDKQVCKATTPTPGTCQGGRCCTGCWEGTACQPGTSLGACGQGGLSCSNCAMPCVASSCNTTSLGSRCEYGRPLNGAGCPHCGGAGEQCCADVPCESGLKCEPIIIAEDPYAWSCTAPPDAGGNGNGSDAGSGAADGSAE
jgi:hypothetical protein